MTDVLTIPLDGLTAEDAEAVRALAEAEATKRRVERQILASWPTMKARWGWYIACVELSERHAAHGMTFTKVKRLVYGYD